MGIPVFDRRSYHCGVDLMERVVRAPWGAFGVGTATAILTAIAILALGAPAWILVPVIWVGAATYAEMSSRVNRRLGRW